MQLLNLLDAVVNDPASSNLAEAKAAFSQILGELGTDNQDGVVFNVRQISDLLLGLVEQMDNLCLPMEQQMGFDDGAAQNAQ